MTSRSRRQTRSRRFGPQVWAPYEHNKTMAERKAMRRTFKTASAALETWSGAVKVAADALASLPAFTAASLATGGFSSAWTIRDQTELKRTIAHADILGMDEDDAAVMIEDFRQTRVGAPSAGGRIREWEDLRDEITDHVLGFGTARLIS